MPGLYFEQFTVGQTFQHTIRRMKMAKANLERSSGVVLEYRAPAKSAKAVPVKKRSAAQERIAAAR